MSPTVVWSLCQAFVHKKQTGIEYALNIYNSQRIIPHDIGDLLTPKQLGQNFHLYIFQEKCSLSSYAGLWHDTYPYQHIHFGLKMTRFISAELLQLWKIIRLSTVIRGQFCKLFLK